MKEYRVYRATKTNSGAASKFQVSNKVIEKGEKKFDDLILFLVSSKQTGTDQYGNASFAWEDKSQCITMKLGDADVGELLAVLSGAKLNAGTDKGLFHQNDNGNTVLQFGQYIKDERLMGYNLRLSRKNNGDKEAVMIQHGLSIGEGEVLRVLLQNFIKSRYGW